MPNNINLLQLGSQSSGPVLSLGLVVAAPLVIGALVAVGTVALRMQAHTLENRVEAAQAAAHLGQNARGSDAAGNDLAQLEHAVEVRSSTLIALKAGSARDAVGYAENFRALARSAIDGVWLTGVVVDREGTTLHGKAVEPARVSAYLASLQREALFAGHAFNVIDVSTPPAVQANAADPAHPAMPAYLEFTLAAKRPGEADAKDTR